MKTITIVGARPQFIKAAPIVKELSDRGHQNILVHTGQHYDYNLSKVFFDELGIPVPNYNLEIGSTSPVKQIAGMMIELEKILDIEKPDFVLVIGDTNSTLAGAMAAFKCEIPVVHIEGGERNFTSKDEMVHPVSIPEEANRVLVDHVSTVIFCASKRAVDNLVKEGITNNVVWVGDISLDIFSQMSQLSSNRSNILEKLNLTYGKFVLTTIHRAINTDYPDRLKVILKGLISADCPVIFPIHPRTLKVIEKSGIMSELPKNNQLRIIEPVGYFDMLTLEKNARIIVTDSGGVIREAFFSGVPSIIVDETTEWIDLVHSGWSRLVGANAESIVDSILTMDKPAIKDPILGYGTTRKLIVDVLEQWRSK